MMQIFRCSLVLLALLLVPAFAVAQSIDPGNATLIHLPSDPDGAMRSARELVAADNLHGAIKQLALYVAAHPDENGPSRLLGDLYYRAGDLPRAENAYKNILMRYPTDKETHNRLGSVFATENRVDDAIAEFKRSLPGTDSVPDLVRLYQRKGQLPDYEQDVARAAFSNPTDPELQVELGQVYEATHRPALAILYFKKAMDNAPGSIMALNGLGLAYMDEHDYPTAERYLGECRSRDPQEYSCADNLAAAYLEAGNLIAAEPMLELAHRLLPERSEAIVNFGYLADDRGDWKGAIRFYLQALSIYPYATDAYIDLGYAYEQHKLYTLAQSALLKGLTVSPNDGHLHFLLGQTYADQHLNALAAQQFKLAAASDDPEVSRVAQVRFIALGGKP